MSEEFETIATEIEAMLREALSSADRGFQVCVDEAALAQRDLIFTQTSSR